ncbi:MAG: glycine/sarcosine/betaine reductase selenoprotein B family protein [Brevefilum sp.]|nr:glycine/sarcosine/betaine reductase selenoprotein B family protein [Brevefilum sp.]MDW7755644.1 glycine/sarcosine/betaine reductase selenoprotein B family protein [Brevefilum sp.]
MNILENANAWKQRYEEKVIQPYRQSGEYNFSSYEYARNEESPAGNSISLNSAKLLLISSSGAYQPDKHEPFDAGNPLGDYSIRQIPTGVNLDEIHYAHEHYDHTYVNQDTGVLIPLQYLKNKFENRELGGLTSRWVSFMGYQPDAYRVAYETTPAVIEAARELHATAALLVPA